MKRFIKNIILIKNRKWLFINLKMRYHLGFSLLEMGVAVTIVSLVLVSSITAVLDSMQLQNEAEQLALAMSLIQSKISELKTASNLSLTDSSGEVNDSSSIYKGFKWSLTIKEENLNLTKILKNTYGSLSIDDKLPVGALNKPNSNSSTNSGDVLKDLGSIAEIPILKISGKVMYPKGKETYGTFNIETMQRSDRSKLYEKK